MSLEENTAKLMYVVIFIGKGAQERDRMLTSMEEARKIKKDAKGIIKAAYFSDEDSKNMGMSHFGNQKSILTRPILCSIIGQI